MDIQQLVLINWNGTLIFRGDKKSYRSTDRDVGNYRRSNTKEIRYDRHRERAILPTHLVSESQIDSVESVGTLRSKHTLYVENNDPRTDPLKLNTITFNCSSFCF